MEGNVLKFSSQLIGEKKLGVIMKKLFLDAGIDTTGRKITNHSLGSEDVVQHYSIQDLMTKQ